MSILHLPPMPEDAPPVKVPGLLGWLGVDRTPDPDFQASVDAGYVETLEAFCERISRTETAS
ncbi:MAG: hypothetical protein K0R62_2695 [Nonomuraea muscovyensis]|nr:hypothetical protein [Nonomuraea muscovyensis]